MRLSLICGLFVVWLAPGAGAATLMVPSEYLEIQNALDAAAPGDTVLVSPGSYRASHDRRIWTGSGYFTMRASAFLASGVVLRSARGAGATSIELVDSGDGIASVVFAYGLSEPASLEGFQIVGQSQLTAAVSLRLSESVVVKECVFENLRHGTGFGGAIVTEATALEVVGCRFVACHAIGGGGIYHQQGSLLIRECEFERCSNSAVQAVGSSAAPGVVLVERSKFIRNATPGLGGAMSLTNYSRITVLDNLFLLNEAREGGGLSVDGGSGNHVVSGNLWVENRAMLAGGAVLWRDAGVTFQGNTFLSNEADVGGAALSLSPRAPKVAHVRANLFAFNEGRATVRLLAEDVSGIAGCNVFWESAGRHANGYAIRETDLVDVDPLMCVPGGRRPLVSSGSPCLAGNSPCATQVGTVDVGCSVLSVSEKTWGAIKASYRHNSEREER